MVLLVVNALQLGIDYVVIGSIPQQRGETFHRCQLQPQNSGKVLHDTKTSFGGIRHGCL